MHGLRHKSLLSMQAAPKGGGTETGSRGDGVKSRINTRRARTEASNPERSSAAADQLASSADGVISKISTRRARAEATNPKRSSAAGGQLASSAAGNQLASSADGVKSRKIVTRRERLIDASNPERSIGAGSPLASCVNGGNSTSNSAADSVNSRLVRTEGINSPRTSANGLNTQMVVDNVGNSQRSNANGNNNSLVEHGVDVGNSQRSSANVNSSQMVGVDIGNSQMNCGGEGVNSELNIGSQHHQPPQDPPTRGRGKMSRTKYKMLPRSGRIQLEPLGHCQFKYVGYNPKGCKYPSQLGTIIKRDYPGVIKIYDQNGRVVKKKPAFSWNDYYWKKNRDGICYAQRVKQEFWSTFTCHPRHRARASKNLENYLVKRVTNMLYQVRLEAVKKWCHQRGEKCDDTRARTIELTEEQYKSCRIEWCNKAAWALLASYWNSAEYKKKRRRAQESRKSSDDPAQNRGGSRNFAETQQFLEFKFGPEKSGTLNTYAVMKSGAKNVDNTGRSAPITSQKAQQRLDDYKELAPDENSKELDGKALYIVGRGMKHGQVPIGDGAVDKATVLAHSRSRSVRPPDPDQYESVVKENEQLKQTNDILIEENSVHRELFMRMYADFGREPPADLLQRLANIDARRHQASGSHGGSHSVDGDDDDDYSYHESHGDDCSNHEGDDDNRSNEVDDDDNSNEGDDDDQSNEGDDDVHSSDEDDDDLNSLEDDLDSLEDDAVETSFSESDGDHHSSELGGEHASSKAKPTSGSGTQRN